MKKQAMHVVLIPDSGTLLQLHRELRLESLFSSFATLAITDASVHELLRFCKNEGQEIAMWIKNNHVAILETRAFNNGCNKILDQPNCLYGLVADIGLQEIMNETNLSGGNTQVIFLLDEHKCAAKNTFLYGSFCTGVTLLAYQRFLESSQPCPIKATQPSRLENADESMVKTHKPVEPPNTQRFQASSPEREPSRFYLNSTMLANPKLVERKLRDMANQTVNIGLKAIDKIKASRSNEPNKPALSAIEKFRRSLM